MKDAIFQLCDQIRETSFSLQSHLRHGHVEKVYENGLFHRLRKQGLSVIQQHPLSVLDEDGTLLGEFTADLFVNSQLIVEPVAPSSTNTWPNYSDISAPRESNTVSS